MLHRPGQFDEFERLMLDTAEAKQAGVFHSTPIDVESLVGESGRVGATHWYRHVLVGLPLAACIAMFFGVATLWEAGSRTGDGFSNGTTAVSTLGGAAASPAGRCQNMENFQTCFRGPGVLVGGDCRCVDFDGDGDVDLRDMGAFQLNRTID